jgi:hypothetical protein
VFCYIDSHSCGTVHGSVRISIGTWYFSYHCLALSRGEILRRAAARDPPLYTFRLSCLSCYAIRNQPLKTRCGTRKSGAMHWSRVPPSTSLLHWHWHCMDALPASHLKLLVLKPQTILSPRSLSPVFASGRAQSIQL